MPETKQIKVEQWSVKFISDKIKNKEFKKDKYQRPIKWVVLTSPKKPSIRSFIDFLNETQNSVHAITFGVQNKDYSNIDGNNRLNAIMHYLEKPFEVYPEHLDTLNEFIKLTYSAEIHDTMISIFSKLTYNDIITFQYQTYFEDNDEEELYEKHLKIHRDAWEIFFFGSSKKNIESFKNKFKINDTINFNDVKININLFEGYSNTELNDVYLKVNQYNSSFTELELLAGRLYNIDDFEIDSCNITIKNNINNSLTVFYSQRSAAEKLQCYNYDNASIMNAYDFIIGYQNYTSDGCKFIERVDNKGLSLFFKLYKAIFKNLDNTFTTNNVNEFILKIEQSVVILNKVHDKLFPNTLTDKVFKNNIKKIDTLMKNNIYIIIASIIGYLNKQTEQDVIVKSIEKSILFHWFVRDVLNNDDNKQNYTHADKIIYEAGGGVVNNLADKMLTQPNLISDKITKELMGKVIDTLIQQNIKNITHEFRDNGKDKHDRRKTRPYYENALMLNYFKQKVPCEYLKNEFWLEHIIPFSSEWNDQIDHDRLGNTIPIIDIINKKRRAKHIKEYDVIEKDINTNFMTFIKDIIPVYEIYDKIVSHDAVKPKIINNELFKLLCEKNEQNYKDEFLKNIFAL